MTSPSSFSVSGLLGGAAGSIDTSALISQLVQAAALPQTNLKNQLAVQQAMVGAYQAINTKVTTMQTAAQALTDPTAWTATTASSSSTAVVATSTGGATAGSTTFDVVHLASSQISTVATGAGGVVVSNPGAGITITSAGGTAHAIALASGTAVDVAAAINAAQVGVRATVVNSDSGQLLQLTSTTTGAAAGFSVTGLDTTPQAVTTATDAQIGVGVEGSGGYTMSSASNTFTGVIPGVTFSVSALATGVSISVSDDQASLATKIKALVDAANGTSNEITNDSTGGAILQGSLDVRRLQQAVVSAVSSGTSSGGSLKTYGVDLDKFGQMSFDADAFAAAYATDPAAAKAAISGSLAANLDAAATSANDPTSGTLSSAITSSTNQQSELNHRIDDWTTRLSDLQQRLQIKYAAMEASLAKLQSQSTYLTSMLKSIDGSGSSSSSN